MKKLYLILVLIIITVCYLSYNRINRIENEYYSPVQYIESVDEFVQQYEKKKSIYSYYDIKPKGIVFQCDNKVINIPQIDDNYSVGEAVFVGEECIAFTALDYHNNTDIQIYISYDLGMTWMKSKIPNISINDYIHMTLLFNNNEGFILLGNKNGHSTIYKYDKEYLEWIRFNEYTGEDNVFSFYAKADTIYLGMGGSKDIKIVEGKNNNWETINVATMDGHVSDIVYMSEDICIVNVWDNYKKKYEYYFSYDGGLSWNIR